MESETPPTKAKGCPPSGCACVAPLGVRAYARHRGCSHPAVINAIASGRLKDSVRDGKVVDVALADREWSRNTSYSEAPVAIQEREAAREIAAAPPPASGHPPPALDGADVPSEDVQEAREGMSLGEASAIEKVWKAKRAKLEYLEAAGDLVPARDVRVTLEDVFRTCRTKLLGVPGRLRQALPHLTHADQVVAENLVREALEDLASGGVLR